MEKLSNEVVIRSDRGSTSTGSIHTSDNVNKNHTTVDSGCEMLQSTSTLPSNGKGSEAVSVFDAESFAKGIDSRNMDYSTSSYAIDGGIEGHVVDTGVMKWLERDLAADQSSLESTLAQERANEVIDQDTLDKTSFKKQQPKKMSGSSLLSQQLATQRHDVQKSPRIIRPPPGFECLGSRKINDYNNVVSGQEGYVPLPELRWLCPPGQVTRKRVLGRSRAEFYTENLDDTTARRRNRKPLKLQSCLDSLVVPYKTKDFKDIEDWFLFDELHQLYTF
ncbi:hypothetical protein MGN70_006866 [Eutypa lata]|nr:hypothetical protein MGN70_006866 [Eutypa lata]